MKFEYWRYVDRENTISGLKKSDSFLHNEMVLTILATHEFATEPIMSESDFSAQPVISVSIRATDTPSRKSLEAVIQFRKESGVVVLISKGDILVSDLVYEFLTKQLRLNLEPFEPGRERLKQFLERFRLLDARVETWRGEVSIASLEDDITDSILNYSLASAQIEIDCFGVFVAKITLDYMHLDESTTDKQRECAFQIIEQYLAV